MLTYHQWVLIACTWGWFKIKCLRYLSLTWVNLWLQSHLPGTNKLIIVSYCHDTNKLYKSCLPLTFPMFLIRAAINHHWMRILYLYFQISLLSPKSVCSVYTMINLDIFNVSHLGICNLNGGFWFLTHWGLVTHICVSKLSILGSDNGLSAGRRQAIIWTNAGILFIRPLGTNFSEILVGIQTFSFRKMHLKMSSAL